MTRSHRMDRREFLGLTAAFGAASLTSPLGVAVQTQDARLEARPATPSKPLPPGESALGLGSGRDGLLIRAARVRSGPFRAARRNAPRRRSRCSENALDLFPRRRVRSGDCRSGFARADMGRDRRADRPRRGVYRRRAAVGVRARPREPRASGVGRLLRRRLLCAGAWTRERRSVQPRDRLFSRLCDLSLRRGKPSVFISHGTQDVVLPINNTSRVITPRLRAAGYDVLYREFDGPHQLLPEIAREAFAWFVK